MGNVATTPDAALAVLLSQPTSVVAAAASVREGVVAGMTLNDDIRAHLANQLEQATGSRVWTLEHLRDHRPLGEMLEVARLIRAQRTTIPGIAQTAVSADVPGAPRPPRQPPHAHVRGRATAGRT